MYEIFTTRNVISEAEWRGDTGKLTVGRKKNMNFGVGVSFCVLFEVLQWDKTWITIRTAEFKEAARKEFLLRHEERGRVKVTHVQAYTQNLLEN